MDIMAIVGWFQAHWLDILQAITSTIGTASIIVKLTPTPNDDAILAKIIAFVSKYIALNKPVK